MRPDRNGNRRVTVQHSIPYTGREGGPEMDLYSPPRARFQPPHPAVVLIHGGGWCGQSRDDPRERSVASDLALGGFVCASIDYTLVDLDDRRERPEHDPALWPRNLHDCKRAVAFLKGQSARLGIDPARIGAIGESAGGHLAAMLGCTPGVEGLDPPGCADPDLCRVRAVVCLYAVSDPAGWITGASVRRRGMVALERMLGGPPEVAPEAYRLASPHAYTSANGVPVLLVHGTADEVVPPDQSREYARALEASGATSQLVLVPGAGHSFDLRPPQRDLRPLVLSFFRRYLGTPTE